MKTLIAYSTTLGCTEQCASRLKEDLGEGVEMIRISSRRRYNLQKHDTIIVGGSIHEGMIQRSVHKFCTSNLDILLKKQVGLFVCCMDPDANEKELIDRAFPSQLVEHALASGFFGGELNIKKMNLLQKIMTRKAARLNKEPDIDFHRILQFARTIHELGSDSNIDGPIVHI
ncbi:MAG: flavodoxin domain-containing protein [Bacteroidales bacterium]|nr:flavodoxin domain-containing protein [Bacteroidales bacterium]